MDLSDKVEDKVIHDDEDVEEKAESRAFPDNNENA